MHTDGHVWNSRAAPRSWSEREAPWCPVTREPELLRRPLEVRRKALGDQKHLARGDLLRRPDDARQARDRIGRSLRYFNDERLHQALGYLTPSVVYFSSLSKPVKRRREMEHERTHCRAPPAHLSAYIDAVRARGCAVSARGDRRRAGGHARRASRSTAPHLLKKLAQE